MGATMMELDTAAENRRLANDAVIREADDRVREAVDEASAARGQSKIDRSKRENAEWKTLDLIDSVKGVGPVIEQDGSPEVIAAFEKLQDRVHDIEAAIRKGK